MMSVKFQGYFFKVLLSTRIGALLVDDRIWIPGDTTSLYLQPSFHYHTKAPRWLSLLKYLGQFTDFRR